MTWATLVARWTEFARSAVALPEDGEGGRYRASVAPVIALQAITHALHELELLEFEERPVAIDKAELGIQRHAAELHQTWRAEALPGALAELIEDARLALAAVTRGGLEWCAAGEPVVMPHPGELAAALVAGGFDGDLLLPTPGIAVFLPAPVAFVRRPGGGAPEEKLVAALGAIIGELADVSGPLAVSEPRQVYRQFDFAAGGPVRDLVRPMEADLPAGQPLLVWAIRNGEAVPVTLPPRGPASLEPLPVVFEGDADA